MQITTILRVKLFDARGRRIAKKIDGVFQYGFIYGNQFNPIAKVDKDGNMLEKYIYGLKTKFQTQISNKDYTRNPAKLQYPWIFAKRWENI